jgi:hypothetical protein
LVSCAGIALAGKIIDRDGVHLVDVFLVAFGVNLVRAST